jgi:hypothetical protein
MQVEDEVKVKSLAADFFNLNLNLKFNLNLNLINIEK